MLDILAGHLPDVTHSHPVTDVAEDNLSPPAHGSPRIPLTAASTLTRSSLASSLRSVNSS